MRIEHCSTLCSRVTKRRTSRRRSLSQLGTWLLPPTPRKLNYLRRYLVLRRSGEFDVDSYLLGNPDVLAAGIDPLMHYVEYGRDEGRVVDGYVHQPNRGVAAEISPSDAVDPADGDKPHWPRWKKGQPAPTNKMTNRSSGLRASSTHASILIRTPMSERRGVDPVLHYVTSGHTEGRDPSADFRTTYYRVKYLNGSRSVNPLVHYSTVGRQAGNHIAPGAHDDADDVHLSISESVRPGDDFEERDPDLAGSSRG